MSSIDGFFYSEDGSERFGGKYVGEVLRRALDDLDNAFREAMTDKSFLSELEDLRAHFIGRPTPLFYAERLSKKIGGGDIYVKLEGFANTGAHKINNAIGQALLAKRMGKKRIIAETGAGQHGVATAAACAKLGLPCTVYMGEVDVLRQQPNVATMELYGATVKSIKTGSRTLKDAINEAMRDWSASFEDTHYLIGSALGPAPFPDIVRTFQSVIGLEVDKQCAEYGFYPDYMVACVGGGSNAIGFFSPFTDRDYPRLVGVEAGGVGCGKGENASRMSGEGAKDGIVHGYKSRFLLEEDGQVSKTRSISAGLDYPGIGPELAKLGREGRIEFTSALDEEALEAMKLFAESEGILFALESAHAGAEALKLAKRSPKGTKIVVNMSGRGDKDLFITSPIFRKAEWLSFLKSEVERIESGDEIHTSKGIN